MKHVLAALVLLAALAAPAHAQTQVVETFRPDTNTTLYRTVTTSDPADLTGAADTSSIAAVTTIDTQGKPDLEVSLRFSASGATCDVTIVRGVANADGTWTTQGRETVTGVAGGSTFLVSSRYVAPDVLLSPGGADRAKIVIHNLSSGTVLIYLRKH